MVEIQKNNGFLFREQGKIIEIEDVIHLDGFIYLKFKFIYETYRSESYIRKLYNERHSNYIWFKYVKYVFKEKIY